MQTKSEIQSRTGGVLGAVPSAEVMGGRRRIFSQGANSGMQKSWRSSIFSRHLQNTCLRRNYTNAQNTLQNFQGGGKCPQTFLFFRRGACVRRRGEGACAMAQWHEPAEIHVAVRKIL